MNAQVPDRRLDEDARAIAGCIDELIRGPKDDRFRTFEAIAYHVENLFGVVHESRFLEYVRDESFRARLLANPAAVPLLLYVTIALEHFNRSSTEVGKTAADRRKAYADAFFLTGKQGEQWAPVAERMGLDMRFRALMDKALAAGADSAVVSKARRWTLAKNIALRETYEQEHGHGYDSNDDTHKSRMKAIRKTLREMGSGDLL